MSYVAREALQGAVYQHLRADPVLEKLIGDAIYDAMPVSAPSGVYVALGPEDAQDAGDMTGRGSRHDLIVSVVAGTEETGGFQAVKAAASAVCAALEEAAETGALNLGDAGHLVGLWFRRARARRVENGAARRVDLTFRARVDMG